ncbi:MAG: hypothetical protein KME31_20135 [Tolypothrix carrinoi HA7290-LM1]|nr:hypothetical protein [Tolypothrix carrinoi HA7290-LM1]
MRDCRRSPLALPKASRPTHCLPLALASPKGRRPRWLTNYQLPIPNDGRCSTWGDPKTAQPNLCPMPNAQPLTNLRKCQNEMSFAIAHLL